MELTQIIHYFIYRGVHVFNQMKAVCFSFFSIEKKGGVHVLCQYSKPDALIFEFPTKRLML